MTLMLRLRALRVTLDEVRVNRQPFRYVVSGIVGDQVFLFYEHSETPPTIIRNLRKAGLEVGRCGVMEGQHYVTVKLPEAEK